MSFGILVCSPITECRGRLLHQAGGWSLAKPVSWRLAKRILKETRFVERMKTVECILRRLVGGCVRLILFAAVVSGLTWAQTQSSVDCRLIAYLPPMATFGGPATAGPRNTELGLAFGGYGEILPS